MNPLQWPWPVPAVVVWAAAWTVFLGGYAMGAGPLATWVIAAMTGVGGSILGGASRWRRGLIALGFPVSWAVLSGALTVPVWVWPALLALGLLLYPPRTWKDAPVFPTPANALVGLHEQVPLPWGGHILDAGCGLGHGLLALERAYPDLYLHGVERSWPLVGWSRMRCRWARVRHGDMWHEDWSRYDMVYLFQRPETMPRAFEKAQRELKPGAWLASLEFAVPQHPPTLTWVCPDGRTLWLYQQTVADPH